MILTGKRGATSPAEAEKKKPDNKSISEEGGSGQKPEGFQMSHREGHGQNENEGWLNGQEDEEVDMLAERWKLQGSSRRGRGGTNSPSKSPSKSFSEVTRQGARRYPDQVKPPGPNPAFLHKHTHPIFKMTNEGAFRDEIEIETQTINGNPFRGTITHREGKHCIYKDIIGGPFSNFRGLRFGFKNVPTVVIMLKEPINLDDLESIQHFNFKRNYKVKDRKTGVEREVEDVIECKIRGVRTVSGGEASVPYSEDWTRVVKVEGCDYRIGESTITDFLGNYGEVVSELVEDVFEDEEDSEGANATGIYSVKVKMNSSIPQLVPLDGRRVKIYYRNIQKQCTKCFGPHLGRNCTNEKVAWLDYVAAFIRSNPRLDKALFGKWNEIIERNEKQKEIFKVHYESKQAGPEKEKQAETNEESSSPLDEGLQTETDQDLGLSQTQDLSETQGTSREVPNLTLPPEPVPSEFNLPETDEAIDEVISKLMEFGMSNADAVANIDKRKKLFGQALKKHASLISRATRKNKPTKSRKDSLNDK